jgi:hypothetical protein
VRDRDLIPPPLSLEGLRWKCLSCSLCLSTSGKVRHLLSLIGQVLGLVHLDKVTHDVQAGQRYLLTFLLHRHGPRANNALYQTPLKRGNTMKAIHPPYHQEFSLERKDS